jgi:hypothetical protein
VQRKYSLTLLQSLAKISKDCDQYCSIRIFVTGRANLAWQEHVKRHMRLESLVQISVEANPDDIRKYVEKEIEIDDNYECMNDTLKNEILAKIVDNSEGM